MTKLTKNSRLEIEEPSPEDVREKTKEFFEHVSEIDPDTNKFNIFMSGFILPDPENDNKPEAMTSMMLTGDSLSLGRAVMTIMDTLVKREPKIVNFFLIEFLRRMVSMQGVKIEGITPEELEKLFTKLDDPGNEKTAATVTSLLDRLKAAKPDTDTRH